MGKYASKTGTSAAVQKFRPDFPKINESTIGEFKKKYKEELKLAKQQNREVRTVLSTEKQGRPLLLGTKVEVHQSCIKSWSCSHKSNCRVSR